MEQKQITHNGKRLGYSVQGTGDAIVLVHGFGETGTVWRNQADIFPNNRVIIPDLPGSGTSELSDHLSIDSMAESVLAVLEAEGVSQCILIGHSMGGYITLAFAERYPHKLTGFGLFHSTAYADTEEKKETRRKGIRFIQEHGAYEFLKTSIPTLYSPGSQETKKELIAEHLAEGHNFSEPALVSYYEAMIARTDRSHILKESINPVLFILGRHDVAVPIDDGLEQCHMPQLSYIHILENSGHMGMVEEPETSNQALLSYIELCKTALRK